MTSPTQPSFAQEHGTEIGAAIVLLAMTVGIVAVNLIR